MVQGFAFWISILANLAIIGTAIFVLLQVQWASEHLRRYVQIQDTEWNRLRKIKALDYIGRWNDPDFTNMQMEARRFLSDPTTDLDEKLRRYKSDGTLRADVVAVLNFLEELAIAIKSRLLDEGSCRDFFDAIILKWYESAIDFIKIFREDSNRNDMHRDFTDLAEKWQRNPLNKGV